MLTWSYWLQTEELVTIKRESTSSNSSQWGQKQIYLQKFCSLSTHLILTFVRSVLRKKPVASPFLQIIHVSRLLPANGLTAFPLSVALEKCYLLLKDITVSAAFLSEDLSSGLAICFLELTWKSSSSVKRLFRASLTPLLLWFWTERR